MSQTIEKKTSQIKHLIERVKNSARDAWIAGETLKQILDEYFQENYSEFNNYTNKEFKISAKTARQYIDIYNNIPFEDIPEDMMLTHIYPLLKVEEKNRLKILNVMTKTSASFTSNNIKQLTRILDISAQEYSEDDIEKELDNIVKEKESKNKKVNKKKHPTNDEQGIPICSQYFQELIKIFPNEPISEQGLVGLFCAMFHALRDKSFEFNGKTVRFDSIEYIRTTYPDARLKALSNPKRILTLDVEFELESQNYIKHGHFKEKNKKCDLIICWTNNLNQDKIYKYNIPKVLSLKDLFESGVISLYCPIITQAQE